MRLRCSCLSLRHTDISGKLFGPLIGRTKREFRESAIAAERPRWKVFLEPGRLHKKGDSAAALRRLGNGRV